MTGSEDAVYYHAKYLLEHRLPIPTDLMERLEAIAREWPIAADLLARIKCREAG